jgi:hypothetical protein
MAHPNRKAFIYCGDNVIIALKEEKKGGKEVE